MRFERIYMQSGTNKKADSTDYVDYYKAENGAVIQKIELRGVGDVFYKVFESEDDIKKYNPFRENWYLCFSKLRDAKDYVKGLEV